jgi:hypothetical protein
MNKCPICKDKDADKKNVHLIPWFLIKNCVTQDGSGERDMELSFSIDPASFTKMYTGRGILPENLEEYGELDERQKENTNPYSRDNIICSTCENKLSRLEAIFASQFSEKKLSIETQPNFKLLEDNSLLVDPKYNNTLYQLLIQSIFYRCSIGRFNGFSLDKAVEGKIEENLRNAFLTENFKKIKQTEYINIVNKFPLLTSAFFVPKGEDSTSKFIVINKSRFPYFIMAGKWMFQLFEAEKHLKSTREWLYGLQDKLNPSKTFNVVKDTSHVIVLEPKTSEAILQNLIHHFTDKKIIGLKKTIRDLHIHIFKQKASEFTAQYIFRQYFIHLEAGKTEIKSLVHAFYDLKKLP